MREKLEQMKIVQELRPAIPEDLGHKELSASGETVKKPNIGMPYYLQNGDGNLEQYYISEHTNGKDLAEFIAEGRCFVLCPQLPGAGKMIEVIND